MTTDMWYFPTIFFNCWCSIKMLWKNFGIWKSIFNHRFFLEYIILTEGKRINVTSGNSGFKIASKSWLTAKITLYPLLIRLYATGTHRVACPNPQVSGQINTFFWFCNVFQFMMTQSHQFLFFLPTWQFHVVWLQVFFPIPTWECFGQCCISSLVLV